MKKWILPAFAALFFVCFSLRGEVFSLWPFRRSAPSSILSADKLFNGEAMRDETGVVNGRELAMNTSIIDADPKEALRMLKTRYPKGCAAMNENGLLFSTPPEKGFVRKILIVAPDGIGKGILFAMTVPEKGFGEHPQWPSSLPFPAGAQALQVISFPQRKAVYGLLRSSLRKEELLSNISMLLKAEGWVSPTKESGMAGGSGEIMFSPDAKEIILVGITSVKGTAQTQVSLYRRRLGD